MHKWLLSFRARMAGLLAWVPRPVRRLLLWTVVAVPAALLVFTLAGAYAWNISHQNFLMHEPPLKVFIEG